MFPRPHISLPTPRSAPTAVLALLPAAAVAMGLLAASTAASDVATATLAVAALVALALLLLARPRLVLGRLEAVALLALAGLLAWTAASVTWSIDPAQSAREAQRTALYVSALAGALAAARASGPAPVVAAVTAACTLISAAVAIGGTDVVGYAGAAGLVAVTGTVLVLGLLARGRRASAPALVPLGAAIVVSGTRAAIVALAAGIVVMALLAPGTARRRWLAAAVAATLLAATTLTWGGSLHGRDVAWGVAWRSAGEHVLHGSGAGAFERLWLRERPAAGGLRNAHELYLETAAELGAVGVALLVAALGAPVAAAVRMRSDPLVPAAAGAYAAFLVHATVHWDWELPVATLPALALGAALLVAARPPGGVLKLGARARAAALTAVALCTIAGSAQLVATRELARSRDAAAVGALAVADASARSAARWAPWAAEPWRRLAESSVARGQTALARAQLERALERDAHDWRAWALLASVAPRYAREPAARRARQLNPLGRIG